MQTNGGKMAFPCGHVTITEYKKEKKREIESRA